MGRTYDALAVAGQTLGPGVLARLLVFQVLLLERLGFVGAVFVVWVRMS